MNPNPVLVDVWRGDSVESFHRGAFAVLDATGRVLLRQAYDRRLAERSAIRVAYALPRPCRNGCSLDTRPDDPRFP